MNSFDNLLDYGSKISVSAGSTVSLTPQHNGCYFVLTGALNGNIVFDVTELNGQLLNFNILLGDITSVDTFGFEFKNGSDTVVTGSFEGLSNEISELDIQPGNIYCFACNILPEGNLNGKYVYSAAVNLVYDASLPSAT